LIFFSSFLKLSLKFKNQKAFRPQNPLHRQEAQGERERLLSEVDGRAGATFD